MSVEMMAVMQIKLESLTRQVEQLAPENERVRNLLTEFDDRHARDEARIAAVSAQAEEVRAAGRKWTDALSRHSVAREAVAENRNELAGEVYAARKAFEAALDGLVSACGSGLADFATLQAR